jgi:hypothetical protein
MFPRPVIVALAMLGGVHSAHAHGIAGNRFFPGTLAFDDPAVADESILPLFISSKHPDEGVGQCSANGMRALNVNKSGQFSSYVSEFS